MLKDIQYPSSFEYKTGRDYDPQLFFHDHFYNSNLLKFHLGFFSTKVFNAISEGFANFIYEGGKVELIINHFLTSYDKQVLLIKEKIDLQDSDDTLEDIVRMIRNLPEEGQHFMRCISYLIENDRLLLMVIKPMDRKGYEHTKHGIFRDKE